MCERGGVRACTCTGCSGCAVYFRSVARAERVNRAGRSGIPSTLWFSEVWRIFKLNYCPGRVSHFLCLRSFHFSHQILNLSSFADFLIKLRSIRATNLINVLLLNLSHSRTIHGHTGISNNHYIIKYRIQVRIKC